MHIEISAGGLSGMTAVDSFLSDFDSYISKADDVISSFATVKSSIANLNGGVGTLQDAWDQIDARVQLEEDRKANAEKIRSQAEDFAELAVRVDEEVARTVQQNKEEFYRVNPWLRPSSQEDKAWYEKVWDWLCDAGENILEGLKTIGSAIADGFKAIGDSIGKLFQAIIDEYNKKGLLWKILNVAGRVVAIVASVAACVATVLTGGLLAPLAAIVIIYTVNSCINNVADIVNIVSGDLDEVGKTNVLKSLLKDGFGTLGEMIGGEVGRHIGESFGNVIYYAGAIVSVGTEITAALGKVIQAPDMLQAIKGGFAELKDTASGLWYIASEVSIQDIPAQLALLKMTIPNMVNLIKCIDIIASAAGTGVKVGVDVIKMITSIVNPEIEVPSSFFEAMSVILFGDDDTIATQFVDNLNLDKINSITEKMESIGSLISI